MNKLSKYAFVFTSGAAVGSVVGGIIVISKALKSESIRDAIKKIIADKIDVLLYGEKRHRRVSRVSYYSYSSKNRRYRIDDMVFETREQASKTLSDLKEIISKYGHVTVADFYDLVGYCEKACYKDNLYGWSNLHKAEVKRLRAGYYIDLPDAKEI